MLVDPALSGLPAFLTPRPGLNSGFMIPQVTAAALVSENKQRAYPASVDSIPTSANQEDHVSMAAHGARRLARMAQERRPSSWRSRRSPRRRRSSSMPPCGRAPPLEAVRARLRREAPRLDDDRYLHSRHRRRRGADHIGRFRRRRRRRPLAGARRMTPGLAAHRAARCAADHQHSPRRDGPRRLGAALRQPVARAARRRLAYSCALRFLPPRSARRWCGQTFRARSST